jgi:drug/metabolite transporter (DMT)-like permease
MFLVLLAGSLWSTTGLVVRLIHEAHVWQILFYRSVAMMPVLFIVIHYRSKNHFLDTLQKAAIPSTLGALGLVFAFAGGILALQTTTVANAVFLYKFNSSLTRCGDDVV